MNAHFEFFDTQLPVVGIYPEKVTKALIKYGEDLHQNDRPAYTHALLNHPVLQALAVQTVYYSDLAIKDAYAVLVLEKLVKSLEDEGERKAAVSAILEHSVLATLAGKPYFVTHILGAHMDTLAAPDQLVYACDVLKWLSEKRLITQGDNIERLLYAFTGKISDAGARLDFVKDILAGPIPREKFNEFPISWGFIYDKLSEFLTPQQNQSLLEWTVAQFADGKSDCIVQQHDYRSSLVVVFNAAGTLKPENREMPAALTVTTTDTSLVMRSSDDFQSQFERSNCIVRGEELRDQVYAFAQGLVKLERTFSTSALGKARPQEAAILRAFVATIPHDIKEGLVLA